MRWDGMGFVVMVVCYVQTFCVTGGGLASRTNKNADVQIRSSQGPSIGLVEGPHEDVNVGA